MNQVQYINVIRMPGVSHDVTIDSGLQWWEKRIPGLSFQIYTTESIENPPLPEDMCIAKDSIDWAKKVAGKVNQTTIIIVHSDTYLPCSGTDYGVEDYSPGPYISIIADTDFGKYPLTWGAVVAHSIGHVYGAGHTSNGDIMDPNNFVGAYLSGIISEQTLHSVENIH